MKENEHSITQFRGKYGMLPSDYYESKHGKPLVSTMSGNLGVLMRVEVETLKRLIKTREVSI